VRVVEIVPVRVVEMVPVAVVEIVPVRVVEIVPVFVVEIVPPLAKVGADIARTNVAAKTRGLRFFIVLLLVAWTSGVTWSARRFRLLSHSFGPTAKQITYFGSNAFQRTCQT
jgi:hypothetical protein